MIREVLVNEAVKRMRILGLSEQSITEFVKYGRKRLSRPFGGTPGAPFYLIPREQEIVSDYEKHCDVLIYHVLEHYIGDYRVYSFLFVDYKNVDKWKEEREELMKCRTKLSCNAKAYVDIPMMPEYKDYKVWDIEVRPVDGGLMRMGV